MERLVKFSKKLISKLYDRKLPSPTGREMQLINELRVSVRGLPSIQNTTAPPSKSRWLENQEELKSLVLENDPREFLRWHLISGTMFVTQQGYVDAELKHLKERSDWSRRWAPAIEESTVGHPRPYWRYPKSSGNLIHHAYHLAVFEECTQFHIENFACIFEFGGGYGCMCRLTHRLGFKGKYVIFDLPAFSLLQQYYLKSLGLPCVDYEELWTTQCGIACLSEFEGFRNLLSHYCTSEECLFIANWSLSEVPTSFRNEVLASITHCRAILISYQQRFEEIDNMIFFGQWRASREDFEWYQWHMEHLPGNWYLIGKRKID